MHPRDQSSVRARSRSAFAIRPQVVRFNLTTRAEERPAEEEEEVEENELQENRDEE